MSSRDEKNRPARHLTCSYWWQSPISSATLWTRPGEIPGFTAAVQDWFDAAGGVARTMVRIFGRALGLGEDGLTGLGTPRAAAVVAALAGVSPQNVVTAIHLTASDVAAPGKVKAVAVSAGLPLSVMV